MYKELNTTKTNELSLLRHGWWSPEYDLTDNMVNYGKLSYEGISKRNAKVALANNTLRFNFESFFSHTILITDASGSIIGQCTREFFSCTRVLTLQSGFTASFFRESFFSREYIWESGSYGKVIKMKNNFPFTLTTDVYVYPTKAPAAVIPILIFLGAHLIILRRRKRAVH
ncbi:MAG: hypothetical protein H7289_12400 [Mucilaginibacter sp.]|nr:hypothetical protein [Mucilaginibacter sp.]